MITQNLHTHSNFCDGKDSPEEIVLKAISLKFDTIGFSGHSPMAKYSRTLEEYKQEITRLKEKYYDKINVFCGLEFEMYSDCDLSGYDYIIGSTHYFKFGDDIVGFDRDAQAVQNVIDTYFDGDGLKYAKAYYENVAKMSDYSKFDIVGHFDLVTKHSETQLFFDTSSKEYKDAALEALHTVSETSKIFEVNTGAMARGFRTSPYPEPFILKEIKNIGGSVIISSDCHDKNFLNYYFDESLQLIKSCGFGSVSVMTKNGFEQIKI